MIIVITIFTGILLGFATSARTPTDRLEDLTRNIIVGMLGAFVGVQIVGRIFETGASTIALTIASVSGATLLLFIVNRFRSA